MEKKSKTMVRKSAYKPLLFTTTMRNPERLKDFLIILNEYNEVVLGNAIIEEISKKLIKNGLYQPTKQISESIKNKWKNEEELSDFEVDFVFKNNPQDHKEAGFDKGWPSRFDTWFKIAKELGFVWYEQNKKIEFSSTGKKLIDKENLSNELVVFANAFSKYQRDNPFKRVSNRNIPLILLLQIIKKINNDPEFNSTGISRSEIPVLLCWKNDNAEELFDEIKNIRKKYGYSPSNENILSICYNLINDVKRDDESILVDYPDDFIRKMRLTGLISIRGGGRFIDLNTKEINAINYILEKYNGCNNFLSERDFFDYISIIDESFVSKLTISNEKVSVATSTELNKWADFYSWDIIKSEMLKLAQKKKSSDDILKNIEQPLRLEFLTSITILKKLPNVIVKPNFISDDEGLPTSFAPGGNPDIECKEDNDTILIEVTLLTGTQQHIRESYSIQRHLQEYKDKGINAYSIFISPKTFSDTLEHAEYIKFKYNLVVKTLDIESFIQKVEINNNLSCIN